MAGRRRYSNASIEYEGSYGFYWTSTVDTGTNVWIMYFGNSLAEVSGDFRGMGNSIRCIKD